MSEKICPMISGRGWSHKLPPGDVFVLCIDGHIRGDWEKERPIEEEEPKCALWDSAAGDCGRKATVGMADIMNQLEETNRLLALMTKG